MTAATIAGTTITAISSPTYSNAGHTQIDCMVTYAGGTVPFTARADDVMPYGVTIFNNCVAATYGAVAAFPG